MNLPPEQSAPEIAIKFLKQNKLILTTAESCTAGMIVALLSDVEGSGSVIESGYVVYSVPAKKRLLKVQQSTIEKYTLCSEEVAREMAAGALRDSTANISVATTGIAGSQPMDGIPPGTICFAWSLQREGKIHLTSKTRQFMGERKKIRESASLYAIQYLQTAYQQLLQG